MDQGHLFALICFRGAWPPTQPMRVGGKRSGESSLVLDALPDARLQVTMTSKGRERSVQTHPLAFQGQGFAVVDCGWSADDAVVRINNQQASGLDPNEPPLPIVLRGLVSEVTFSLNDPAAASACSRRVSWRREQFGAERQSPSRGRRLKTLREQVGELARARDSLADLIRLVQMGRQHMVGHVATDLRSLVYWRGRYSPLLLRIAGRFDLPLPVYYVPNHPPGALSVQPESHLIGTKGSLFREFEAQVIGDLQDWLEAPAIATPAGVQRQLSVIGAIKEMASTLGSAHYDLDVPIALESLYSFSGPASDELTALIGSAATVVHALSDYVLLEVKSRLDAA